MICSKDDSGVACPDCLCMFNPIVVIATHQRVEITTLNITLLKQQSVVPRIVIVCSLQTEFEYYKTLGVSVILEPNTPLGRKWQCGVNVAVNMNANPMIILGSDDLLHKDYIKEGLMKMKEGYDFIGTTAWYNFDVKRDQVFKCNYVGLNINFPIGSGKMYSQKSLSQIRNKVFDTNSDKRLDDQGHKMLKNNNIKMYIGSEAKILAIKGNWHVMNDTVKYLRGPNIQAQKSSKDILKEFGYVSC